MFTTAGIGVPVVDVVRNDDNDDDGNDSGDVLGEAGFVPTTTTDELGSLQPVSLLFVVLLDFVESWRGLVEDKTIEPCDELVAEEQWLCWRLSKRVAGGGGWANCCDEGDVDDGNDWDKETEDKDAIEEPLTTMEESGQAAGEVTDRELVFESPLARRAAALRFL